VTVTTAVDIGLVLDSRDPDGLAPFWAAALGTTRRSPDVVSSHGCTWSVMADPEGNEFCLCNTGSC